jgi:hypothetical protein
VAFLIHVLNVLEAVPQVTYEWVVDMLEHASFANDVANALGPYHWNKGISRCRCETVGLDWPGHTFIFSNVLQGERQPGVFPLDNSNLSKGASSDNPQQAEMVQIHCIWPLLAELRPHACCKNANLGRRSASPSPSNSTGFPWLFPIAAACCTLSPAQANVDQAPE